MGQFTDGLDGSQKCDPLSALQGVADQGGPGVRTPSTTRVTCEIYTKKFKSSKKLKKVLR